MTSSRSDVMVRSATTRSVSPRARSPMRPSHSPDDDSFLPYIPLGATTTSNAKSSFSAILERSLSIFECCI